MVGFVWSAATLLSLEGSRSLPCLCLSALHSPCTEMIYFKIHSGFFFRFQRASAGVCYNFVAHGCGALYQVSIPYHTIYMGNLCF